MRGGRAGGWRLGAGGAVLLALLLLGGCGAGVRQDPPAAAEVPALAARLGQAPCVVASLLIKRLPPEGQGEGELFSLRLWAPPDGRVRVLAQKMDVDFLAALVAADGTFTVLDPRAGVWADGRLGDPAAPSLLRDLALLVGEARHGPVPPDAVAAVGDDGAWRYRDPITGWDAELTLGGGDGLPAGKLLRGADGGELRRLGYERWTAFEGLQRPGVVRLTVAGDPAAITIRIKDLDAPATVSDERMALRLPEGARQVGLAELLDGLGR